ncbi:MAG: outer membrane beta-barrel protein, partial [Alphaproteobacteria bacterium]|nr:outer membrane beta-barrel protein [Alphaproteobacteria bacterium]
MRLTRCALLLAGMALGLPTPAHAENDWRQGLYMGASIGRSKTEFTVEDGPQNPNAWWAINDYDSNHVQGISVAAQVGYNVPVGDFVLGAELELGKGILNLSQTDPTHEGPFAHVGDRFYTTVTGHAGYVAGPAMFYLKAGYGQMMAEFNWEDPTFNSGTSDIKPIYGLVAGGGIEYRIRDNVTLKADYTRFDFSDTNTLDLPFFVDFWEDPIEINPIDTFRLGVNFQFDGPIDD